MCSAAPSSPRPRPAPPLAHPEPTPSAPPSPATRRQSGRCPSSRSSLWCEGRSGARFRRDAGPFPAACGGGGRRGRCRGRAGTGAGSGGAAQRSGPAPPVRGAAAMLRGDEFLSSPPRKAVRFGGTLPDILLKYGQVSLRERPCGGAATPALSAERVAQTARQLQLQLPLVLLPPPSVGFPSCSPSLCRCLAALGRLGTLAARVGFVRRVVNILYFSSPC